MSEIDELSSQCSRNKMAIDTAREDVHFLAIALNLSGERSALETKAEELINSEGTVLAALRASSQGDDQ